MTSKKRSNIPSVKNYTCYICGKEISGDHVQIVTKRRSKLHINLACMRVERKDK